MNMNDVVGEIEDDGSAAHCFLCHWRAPASSLEQAEFLMAKHLRDAHNKRLEEVDGISIPYPWSELE